MSSWSEQWFRVRPGAKWHRAVGKAAWCNATLRNTEKGVEWEIRRPAKNLCERCDR